jgi:tryptophan halogenase
MKILVLGGGTAGWLTALFLKKHLPKYNISLIESEKIGIIGVGEGSTPVLFHMLTDLNINIPDLIKKTDATIKHGILFQNWSGEKESYFHSFGCMNKADQMSINNVFSDSVYDYYLRYLINNNLDLEKYEYATMLAAAKKVDVNNAGWALHFNSVKLSSYLKELALKNEVKHYYDDFVNVVHDDKNFIKKIKCLKNTYECDFVFDCTGFNREIIEKFFKTNWVSYSSYLPMKKAIPFFLDSEEEINSYTSAIAMKYGWVWKIPLQNRIGSGYIFDSDYINEEQALKEAEIYFNKKLTINKIIPFKPGRFEKTWVNNCISIGLSYGFTEPLEASSIQLQIGQLFLLKKFLNKLKNFDQEYVDDFNIRVAKGHDTISHFIHLHYLTERKDSLFWKEFKHRNKTPLELLNILKKIKDGKFENYQMKEHGKIASFDYYSYLLIAHGQKLIEKKFDNEFYEDFNPDIHLHQKKLQYLLNQSPYHKQFLNNL